MDYNFNSSPNLDFETIYSDDKSTNYRFDYHDDSDHSKPDEFHYHSQHEQWMNSLTKSNKNGFSHDFNDIINNFSIIADQTRMNHEKSIHRTLILDNNHSLSSSQSKALISRHERDFWTLVSILNGSKLLIDINDDECRNNLSKIIISTSSSVTLKELIETAFDIDERLKKGRLIEEWLENSALDSVCNLPKPLSKPWSSTLKSIIKRKKSPKNSSEQKLKSRRVEVDSLHPDAQITSDGYMIPLDGYDCGDQENLLKTIWLLIRSGQLQEAQRLAISHEVLWLAASLQGCCKPFYQVMKSHGDEEGNGDDKRSYVIRRGNVRHAICQRICWKHAERLSSNPKNSLQNDENRDDNVYGSCHEGLSCVIELLH
jgi:hypothetical protein